MQHHSSGLPFRCRYLQQYHPCTVVGTYVFVSCCNASFLWFSYLQYACLTSTVFHLSLLQSCGKPGFVLNKDFKGVINQVSTFTKLSNCCAGLIRSIAVVLDLTTSLFNSCCLDNLSVKVIWLIIKDFFKNILKVSRFRHVCRTIQ